MFNTHSKISQTILFVSLLISLPINGTNTAMAQNQIRELAKINGDISIDGVVDEPVWDEIAPVELKQKVPDAGAPPSQQTQLRIAYDHTYLYLSARMYDAEPDRIIANTKKRDDFTENTEWCGFLIDTYDDRENALAFYVTPTGAKLDMAIANDAEGGSAFNLSWDSYWDAASSVTDEGWFAEIRIPFAVLPFEVVNDAFVMGITAWRYIARNDETAIYPPRDPSLGSSFKPSLTQRFVFKNVEQRKPVYISPYTLSGMETTWVLPDQTGAYAKSSDFINQVGLDAKIALKSNATLDLTLNTDFAQVEADDQQINLTRLNLFFPEKRQFFQERSSLFDFNFGAVDKVFHSRRIGIVNGEQTRIYGGARAFSRFGKTEIGALTMQTGARQDVYSENFGVIRVRRNVLNENSTIGAILTNRMDLNGRYNTVYGFDATLKLFKQNYTSFRIAQSRTQNQNVDLFSLNPTKFFIEFEKRSLEKLTYKANYSRAGDQYDPQMGFEQRDNFAEGNVNLAYNFFPGSTSKLLQVGPYLNSNLIWDNLTDVLESRSIFYGIQAFTKSGWLYDIHLRSYREEAQRELQFPRDVVIPAGQYNFTSITGSVITSSARDLSYSAFVEAGAFYHGKRFALNVSSLLNVTPDFILEAGIDYNLLDMPDSANPVQIRLLRLKASYTFNTKLFFSALTQFNNVTQKIHGNVRLRYNAKDGNDLYLVYNTSLNQNRTRVLPHLPVSNQGTLLLKYTHTFHL